MQMFCFYSLNKTFLAFLFALMQKETKKSRQTPLLRRLCHPSPPFLFYPRPVIFCFVMIEARCKTPLRVMRRT